MLKILKWVILTEGDYGWLKFNADKVEEYKEYKKIADNINLKKELRSFPLLT